MSSKKDTKINPPTRKELRNLLKEAAINKFPRFLSALDSLDDKDFVKFYLDLLNYSIPKIQSIALDDNGDAVTGVEHLKIISEWRKIENKKDIG